jgi:hypothetical protein
MSKKVLVNVNMSKNQIENAAAHNLPSAPDNPVVGQEYFNTSDKQKYIWSGTAWVSETAQGTTYTEGIGIDISGNVISADFTAVATAAQGALADSALQSGDDISELNNDAGYITGITSSDVTTALGYTPYNSSNPSGYQANVIETIKVNNTALTPTSKTVNITIPTTAADVGALPSSTKYGAAFVASLNTTDYKLTMTLKDQDGNTLGTAQTIDFPIESVVVGGSYDSTNKKIVLTLQNGNTIDVPVGDLIAGLQSEITSTNKLDADLVDDSTSTNKFVTAANKTTWNNKQDAISDLATIRSGAGLGATSAQTYTTTNPALTQTGGVCTWTVTHNLGANVVASVYDATTNEEVIVTVEKTSSTVATVKINSTANIASGAYRVVVIGK